MNDFLKKFTTDAVVYGLGRGIKKFIGLFLLPFYARALSTADYGILDTLGTFVFFIIVFLNLGLDSAVGFYFFEPQDEKERGKVIFTTFVMRLFTIIPASVLAFFSKEISLLLFKTDLYTKEVLITCFLLPINVLTSEQELIYRFHRQPWKYNLLTIIKTLLNITLGILLVIKFQLSVFGAQTASLISGLSVVLFSYFFYTRTKYTYEFSFVWAKKLFKYGFPFVFAGIGVWIYQSSDRYFLLYFQNLTDIGYYSIGSTFSQPIGLINMAVQMSFGVLFYEIYFRESQPEKPESKKAIRDLLKIYITGTVLLALLLSSLSYFLVKIIATEKFLPGIIVIPILLYSSILAQLTQILGIGITLSKKTIYFTYIIIISAIVNAGLNFYFVPRWSYYGASITTLISYLVNLWLTVRFSQKYFPIRFNLQKTLLFANVVFIISVFLPFVFLHHLIPYPWIIIINVMAFFSVFIFRIYQWQQLHFLIIWVKNRIIGKLM